MTLRDTVVCVASGPSLTTAQCASADRARRAGLCSVIVVNNNWTRIPDADILYACDGKWWLEYAPQVRAGFRGECWTHAPLCDADGTLNKVEQMHADIVSSLPWLRQVPVLRASGMARNGAICMGGNSGHQAINLAYLFGARRILLIGYDMQPGPSGESHWHGDHPKPLTNGAPTTWVRGFEQLAKEASALGCEIINCTVRTRLTCFPLAQLEDVL